LPVKKKQKRFERLMMPHLDSAFNLARYITGNSDDAYDLVQDAYLRAYQSFDRYHDDNSKAWMLTIVRNTCFTFLSRNKKISISFDENLHTDESLYPYQSANSNGLDYELEIKQDQRIVQKAIESLPTEFREVIVLRELEALSYREIATVMNIPQGTVMSRLSRARDNLKKILSNTEEVAE
jgi:RNA polymerase sigma-70 factor (ECF subfamily)